MRMMKEKLDKMHEELGKKQRIVSELEERLNASKSDLQEQLNQYRIQLEVFNSYGLSPAERIWNEFLCEQIAPMVKRKLSIYISYAWEKDKKVAQELQSFLRRLKKDLLKSCAERVFLDVDNMTGDLVDTMKERMATSDFCIVIGTPQLLVRLSDGKSGVSVEWEAIKTMMESGEKKNFAIPLWYSGDDCKQVFPPELLTVLYRDAKAEKLFSSNEDGSKISVKDGYYKCIAGFSDPMGLIRHLIEGSSNSDANYEELYKSKWRALQLEFKEIEYEIKLKEKDAKLKEQSAKIAELMQK